MTFSGLTFAGQLGSLVAMQAAGVTWSDCRADSPVGANGTVAGLPHFLYCTDVDLVRCNLAGIKMSSGLRLRARDCTAGIVTAEQGQIETTLTNCRVGWLDALHQCDRWKLTGCHFSDWFGIYDGWTVLDCTCNGLVRVRGKDCTIDGLRAIGPVIVQNAYGHGPPDAATGVHLSNVDCEYVELLPGTSGRIAKCNARIVCRDPATKANWKLDGGVIP